ncbi:MAG: hypothetical protein ABFD46_04475 [Armatimonadota bacterium]
MSDKQKLSFWDMPPWYEKWRYNRWSWPVTIFILLPLWILYKAYMGKWADAYALAAPYLAYGLVYVIKKIIAGRQRERNFSQQKASVSKQTAPGCFSLAAAFVILEFAGFCIFGFRRKSGGLAPMLDVTIIAAAFLALSGVVAAAHALWEVFWPRPCQKCGAPRACFNLECSGRSKSAGFYCHEHFRKAVDRGLKKYNGWFLLVDRPLDGSMASQLLSFYAAEDMAEGSYPGSDIESVKQLLESAKSCVTEDTFAMPVPAECVSPFSQFGEEPLFKCKPEDVRFQPMTRAEFDEWFDRLLSSVDESGHKFRMNLPYCKMGVYIREALG